MHFPWQKHSTRSRKKCYELSLENLDAQRNSPPSSDCFMMTWLEKCCRTANPLKDLISRMEWDKDACLLRCNSTYTSLKCYSLPYLGIYILDRLDGSLIDLSCLTAKTKTLKRLLIEALFADDSTLMAHIGTPFTGNCRHIIWSCNDVWPNDQSQQDRDPTPACTRDPSSTALYHNRWHSAKDRRVIQIPGEYFSNDGTLDREITARIQKADFVPSRVRTKVLQHRSIYLSTKLKVYNAIFLPSILYGSESCTLYRKYFIVLT